MGNSSSKFQNKTFATIIQMESRRKDNNLLKYIYIESNNWGKIYYQFNSLKFQQKKKNKKKKKKENKETTITTTGNVPKQYLCQ